MQSALPSGTSLRGMEVLRDAAYCRRVGADHAVACGTEGGVNDNVEA
jgi:hypothetical protein